MKKRTALVMAILILLTLLVGCGSSKNMSASNMAPGVSYGAAPDADYGYDGMVSDKAESASGSVGVDIYTNENNKIIRTADLTIQTTEFDVAVAELDRLTREQGGYYETARVESGGYYDNHANRSAHYVVRIPKENFVAFRDGTGGIGHIYSISEGTVDVGEQYYDTEARLETLTTKRQRLLALLDKAEVMEDIITLENALAEVQYEIDRHTATLRKYDSLIGYATFNIHLNEVVKITDEPPVTESFGSRLLAGLKTGFEDFGEGVQTFVLWIARNLIGVVFFVAVIVVAGVIIYRRVRRRQGKHE